MHLFIIRLSLSPACGRFGNTIHLTNMPAEHWHKTLRLCDHFAVTWRGVGLFPGAHCPDFIPLQLKHLNIQEPLHPSAPTSFPAVKAHMNSQCSPKCTCVTADTLMLMWEFAGSNWTLQRMWLTQSRGFKSWTCFPVNDVNSLMGSSHVPLHRKILMNINLKTFSPTCFWKKRHHVTLNNETYLKWRCTTLWAPVGKLRISITSDNGEMLFMYDSFHNVAYSNFCEYSTPQLCVCWQKRTK